MTCLFNLIFYSIFGFIYETILKIIFSFNYDSGIMYGPYTFLYGLCITLMFFIFERIKIGSNIRKVLMFFILSFIIITTIEWITGILLEKLFNLVYWNYTNYPLNIGKYISIPTSFFWSMTVILLYYFIKPLTDKLYAKTPKIIIAILGVVMLIDFIISLIIKLKI